MVKHKMVEWLESMTFGEGVLIADGFDDALIGLVGRGPDLVALYDSEKCIEILVSRDEMTLEEAMEFFDYNVLGAYMGDRTPMFAIMYKEEKNEGTGS